MTPTERRAPEMPWPCFICGSMAHDCGHREPEILIHLKMPFVRNNNDWWRDSQRRPVSWHAQFMRKGRMTVAGPVVLVELPQ